MDQVLRTYLRRLTDLSGNNRSLLFLKILSDQTIDVHDLDYINDESSFQIINQIIGQERSIKLCDVVDPRDQQANKLARRLKKLARIDNFIFQERGARDLYIGWPFVQGKFNDGTPVRCPLVFFPVTLSMRDQAWYLEQRQDVNITFNKNFLLGYFHYNQLPLDENLVEFVLNGLNRDSTVYRTELYELLKESQLNLQFNQELFMDQLKPFKEYNRAAFEEDEKNGILQLKPEAMLGIFPQAGSYLIPDYLKLLEGQAFDSLESFFLSKVKENPEEQQATRPSDLVKEETTFTPLPLDASQEWALKLIKNGNSMVVQGPPGTGKSQLICNLVSDFIARGKNVLVVSQKRAALDVVYQRLKDLGIHDFAGLVHDFKNDRKSIYQQLAHQIDSLDEYEQKNNALDTVHLERQFVQASRTIDAVSEELEEYKKALYDESECGRPVKELYLSSDPQQPAIPLNQEYREFPYNKEHGFQSRLKKYITYALSFEESERFWINGPSFAGLNSQDLLQIKELIQQIPAFNTELIEESSKFMKVPLDYESALHFIGKLDKITELAGHLDNDTTFRFYQEIQAYEPQKDTAWLTSMERTMLQCYKGVGMETFLKSNQLGKFQEALERAIKARRNAWSWIKWKLFSADKIFISRILASNHLKATQQGFDELVARIDNRLNYEHIYSQIKAHPWLIAFPSSFRKIEIQNWFFYQKLAMNSYLLTKEIRTLDQFLPVKHSNRKDYQEKLSQLAKLLERVPSQLQQWARYFNESQVRAILLGKVDSTTIERELHDEFENIVEFHKLTESFTNPERRVLENLLEHGEKNHLQEVFENSLALAWIDHIETKYPILRAASSLKLGQMVQELREAIQSKKESSIEIPLIKARERTYTDLEYNRLNNLVSYRELYHQVTKKRMVWPIRKVIAQFYEEVFSLLPCWLASPESASAIFPMQEIFDLVIFDEASQCFAERGIPAMYRGRQVVIAGDDKQLQPNDLYKARWQGLEDEDENPDTETTSLLNLAKYYLKDVALKGHYRSRALELIAFSNQHFYNGKLKTLPHIKHINLEEPAILYHKVAGVWKDSTNEIEAQEVISITKKLMLQSPEKSFGIITFNSPQQNLIQDLVEDDGFATDSSLFVKNIENVQGDERDVILFSTGYAPDENGKVSLRFGSLNLPGGENRLNVAITRARERVIVVSSLLPYELDTSETTNAGPSLLKAYLQHALDVSKREWAPRNRADATHRPSWYLRDKLTRQEDSISIKKDLPFADLSVTLQGKYAGVILTDDETFHQSQSAKEAFGYRQDEILEKGWPHIELQSREYWTSRQKLQEKVNKFLHRLPSR